MPSRPSLFRNCSPEFVAVVLASSTGSRLFPITSAESLPKHMIPICGIPVVARLLTTLEACRFQECVVVLAAEDNVTIPYLKDFLLKIEKNDANGANDNGNIAGNYQMMASNPHLVLESETTGMKITILHASQNCAGSIDALRKVEEAHVVSEKSNMVVVPGDLVVFDTSVLRNLCDTHREGSYQVRFGGKHETDVTSTACTVLLTDVGEQDEQGVPLKESAKQKKGGVARDEEEIEYIGLSYPLAVPVPVAPRVVWKQLKIDVHDTTAGLAETPKLPLPKSRIRAGGVTRVRTDWNDVHVYALSPWVRRLLVARKPLVTLQGDLLPLLVSRQFEGVAAAFGGQVEESVVKEILLTSPDLQTKKLGGPIDYDQMSNPLSRQSVPSNSTPPGKEYAVLAHLQDEAARTHTIASYMHASREVVRQASISAGAGGSSSKGTSGKGTNPCLQLPPKTLIRSNFHTILLPGASVGDKVTLKSTTVGRNCKLGNKCRLNNVILMDDVTIGDNVVMQNSIVGSKCKIGDNCNLNDCQVAPGTEISSGEKAKGETFS